MGLLIFLICSIFWIMMLVDCIKHEKGTELLVWILVIIFTHLLGAIIYYFCRKSPRGY